MHPPPSSMSIALSLPSQWVGLYSDFITRNAGAVSQIESGLRSLTYIIPGIASEKRADDSALTSCPGRYRESEIASESRT